MTKLTPYSKYSPSSHQKLGNIPEHWLILKIKYLMRYQKGGTPIIGNSQTNKPLYPYLSMDYLRGREGEVLYCIDSKNGCFADEGDILLLWDGSNAGEFLKSKKGILSSTLAKLYPNSTLDKSFLWYALKHFQRDLQSDTIGMGIPHVDGYTFKNGIIPFPNKEEQILISRFLDKKSEQIARFIELKTNLISVLEERKKTVINNAVMNGVRSNGKLKFSGVEKLGHIPENWTVVRNWRIFRERRALNKGRLDLPLLSVSINTGASFYKDDTSNINKKAEDISTYQYCKTGDIIYNKMRMWQGAVGVAPCDGLISPAYQVLIPDSSVESAYFEFLFRTDYYKSEANKNSYGIAMDRNRLYWSKFKDVLVAVPPREEQLEILDHINARSREIDLVVEQTQKEIDLVNEYKQILISEAVTGKIDVRDQVLV